MALPSSLVLQLEGSLVLVALDGVKDDVGIGNRLAVVVADDSDTNRGGKRRGLVFTAMMRVIVLGAQGETAAIREKDARAKESGRIERRNMLLIVNGRETAVLAVLVGLAGLAE